MRVYNIMNGMSKYLN